MKKRLVFAALPLTTAILLIAQTSPHPPVLMADDGTVIPAHRAVHRKRGEAVTWGRQTNGQTSWYVRFTDNRTPCQEGSEFGAGRATRCTISVTCDQAQGCVYHYRSAVSANGPQHDPDIVVDP